MADKYTPERATSGKERLRTWWVKVENNFVNIFGAVNKHIDGTADRHTADMIDYSDAETVGEKLEDASAKLEDASAKLETKVDKIEGKGLSTNDYTDAEKAEVATIEDKVDAEGALTIVDAYLTNSLPSSLDWNYTIYSSLILGILNGKTTPRSTIAIPVGDGNTEYGLAIRKGHLLLKNGFVCVDDGDIAAYTNETVHKLSEKANISNSSGGFAAGDGAYAYGTREVGSGEIGLPGMTDLNAIQLGAGTNGQEFSVKVYDYVLVVSDEESGKKSATDGKKYIKDVGKLSDLATTDKTSIVAAINEVKSSGGDVLDNLTYDSTNEIINSDANLLLTNTNSVAAYNGTFRGEIKVGQLGENKWAYTISPITGFSTSVDVTCTSGNKVHSLANKADSSDVLAKTNTAKFTPTGDYQPATKKYVDDAIAALKSELGLE